jgi:hypothetical protein
MSDAGEPLTDRQKKEIAVWFLSNAPAGEIHYVAKGSPPPLPPAPSSLIPTHVIELNV